MVTAQARIARSQRRKALARRCHVLRLHQERHACWDGSALPAEEAGALVIGVVDAISYLHSNELCHGDIKLSNVMMDGPIVRLIDFGTARHTRPSSAAPPPLPGTLPYTSPEALDGPPHDGRPAALWARAASSSVT
jgi:serine/threonine protein kinase